MAAGKTTIGRHLARELGVPFVDTDDAIVARHGPIAELFRARGEAGFREAEFEAVRGVLDGPPCVIALGGGAVTHAPTRALLRDRALRVYLQIPVESLFERLQHSRTIRPVLGEQPTLERVRELLAPREPLYLESDIIVPGPHHSKRAFALAIAARLRDHAGEGRAR
jgi:shikimate kinase/3-dehydroquinate synthase